MRRDFGSLFETILSVPTEDIEWTLQSLDRTPWSDFLLNPRRLRGSDFLMRWSQGAWSEERLKQAVNQTGKYYALPYGPSGIAPKDDVRAHELYFERLEKAGLGKIKRPDLLVFRASDKSALDLLINKLNGIAELPFTKEENENMQELLSYALIAVECENSLWRVKQMPDFGVQLTPQKRLGGLMGLKKSAVVPTIIIKEEDRKPLLDWQNGTGIRVHIWHAFFDLAYGINLSLIESLIANGDIDSSEQVFQAPGGATTRKIIYKIYYHHAYRLAVTTEEPELVAESITDKNGHILPYVRFVGGNTVLTDDVLTLLDSIGNPQ